MYLKNIDDYTVHFGSGDPYFIKSIPTALTLENELDKPILHYRTIAVSFLISISNLFHIFFYEESLKQKAVYFHVCLCVTLAICFFIFETMIVLIQFKKKNSRKCIKFVSITNKCFSFYLAYSSTLIALLCLICYPKIQIALSTYANLLATMNGNN